MRKTTDGPDETFGGLIRWQRQRQGLTISELALKTNLSAGYISKLEKKSEVHPSDTILYRIAQVLGLSIMDLKNLLSEKPKKLENKREATPNGIRSNYRETSSLPTSVLPLGHDVLGTALDLHHDETQRRGKNHRHAYAELADAYIKLGTLLCTEVIKGQSLDYRGGFAAYYAGASIYASVGMGEQLNSVRYRIARTYQNLVTTEQAAKGERVLFLYRASELLEQVYIGEVLREEEDLSEPARPYRGTRETRQLCLKPAVLATGALVSRMLAFELAKDVKRLTGSSDLPKEVQTEMASLRKAAAARRIQADLLYGAIIQTLKKDKKVVGDLSEAERLTGEYVNALLLSAINLRGRGLDMDWDEEYSDEKSETEPVALEQLAQDDDFRASITLMNEAIRQQRQQVVTLLVAGDIAQEQMARRQLSRVHRELAITYSCIEGYEAYAQSLWNDGIAREVGPTQAGVGLQPDRYVAGDHSMRRVKKVSIGAANQDELMQNDLIKEQQNVDLLMKIDKAISALKEEDIFATLTYPAEYTNSGAS